MASLVTTTVAGSLTVNTGALNAYHNSTGTVMHTRGSNLYFDAASGATNVNFVYRHYDETYWGQMEFTASQGWLTTRTTGPLKLGVNNAAVLTLTSSGSTFAGALTVGGNINKTGDLTLDSSGNIVLDADGNNITLKDGGTDYGNFTKSSNDFVVQSTISNGDILFKGSDSGSAITALYFDMSEAGDAFFNADIRVLDNRRIRLGTSQDFLIYHEPDLNIIRSGTSDQDIAFQGNDGGSLITALTLDMSEAGAATFGGVATFSGRYVQFKDGSTIGGLIGTGSSLSAAGAGDLVVRTGGKLEFVTNDAWSTPRMTILSDGKVGIGTTSPSYQLDVNGTLRATGAATFDGTVAITGALSPLGSTNYNDNCKAKFGNGNDLEIYHDGNSSFIKDAGTGGLYLYTNTLAVTNAAGNENMIYAAENGAVTLYYDNAVKLATASTGIDVTGNIDTDTLNIMTGGHIKFDFNGVNTHFTSQNSPYIFAGQGASGNYLAGTLNLQSRSSYDRNINFITGATPAIRMAVTVTGVDVTGTLGVSGALTASSDLSVAEYIYHIGDTNTYQRFQADQWTLRTGGGDRIYVGSSAPAGTTLSIITTNGKVGIGTTSPEGTLHVETGSAGTITTEAYADDLIIENSDHVGIALRCPDAKDGFILFQSATNDRVAIISAEYNGGDENLAFAVDDDVKMTINDSGNVGIGIAAPATSLDVRGSGMFGDQTTSIGSHYQLQLSRSNDPVMAFRHLNAAGVGQLDYVDFYFKDTGGTERLAARFGAHHSVTHATQPGADFIFSTTPAGGSLTERMRINDDGNVGIGDPAPDAKLRVYGGDVKLSYSAGSNPYTLRAINDAFWMIGDGAATQEWVMSKSYAHDYAFHFKYTSGTSGAGAGIMKMGQQSKNHANYTHGITAFYTNGAERMRIAADGNVGIGTTSPDRPLHVYTGTAMDDVVKVYQNAVTGHAFIKSQRNGGAIWWAGATRNSNDGDLRANTAIVATWTNHDMDFLVNAANVMTLKSGGNVGIGTNAPAFAAASGNTVKGLNIQNVGNDTQASLRLTGHNNTGGTPGQPTYTELLHAGANLRFDINHNGTVRFSIASTGGITFNSAFTFPTADGTAGYHLQTDGSGNVTWAAAGSGGGGTVTGTGTDNYVPRWNGTTALQNSALFSDDNGNIGINSATPKTKLDVNTGTADAQYVSIGGTISSGEWMGVHFGYVQANDTNYRKSMIAFERQDSAARGKIHFLNNAQNGANSATLADSQMTIQYDGNVGIGTTAPVQKLHVVGGASTARLESTSSTAWLQLKGSTTYSWQIGATSTGFQFYSDETATYTVAFNKSGNATFSGNLSAGGAGSTWVGYSVIQVKAASMASSGVECELGANVYYNSGWKYYNGTVGATLYEAYNGVHKWKTAPSGTVNTAVALTDRMNLSSTGLTITGTGTFSGALTATSATFTGVITADAGLVLNDNDKIKLGTGGDLEIFHTGSESYISDVGGGDLNLATNGNRIKLWKGVGVEAMANFEANGAVTLYYNGAAKLATSNTGVSITGGLGVGRTPTSSGAYIGGTEQTSIERSSTAAGSATLYIARTGTTGNQVFARFFHGGTAGSVASGTEAISLAKDASWFLGSVGIGTTAPGAQLDVRGAGQGLLNINTTTSLNASYLSFVNTAGTAYVGITNSTGGTVITGGTAYALCIRPPSGKVVQFGKGDGSAPTVTIDDSGGVSAIGIFKSTGSPTLSAAAAAEAILTSEPGYGAFIYGQGTTYDVTLGRRNTAVALGVTANTVNIVTGGDLAVGGNLKLSTLPSTTANAAVPILFRPTEGTISGDSVFTWNPAEDSLYVNGTVITANYIRSTGSNPMKLGSAAGGVIMELTSTGKVGIGTDTASSILHVDSEISLGQDGNNRSMLGYSNSTNRLYIGTRQSSTNYFDTVSVTSGKVGIGTTAPARPLAIYNNSLACLQLCNSTTGAAAGDGFQMQLSGSTGYIFNYESGDIIFGTSSATRLTLKAAGQAVFTGDLTCSDDLYLNGTDAWIISGSAGSVNTGGILRLQGFGELEVDGVLDINGTGTSTFAGALTVGGKINKSYVTDVAPTVYAQGNEGLAIYATRHDGSNYRGYVDFVAGRGSDATNGGASMRFFTQPRSSAAPIQALTLQYDGKVGIGTTSPGAPLVVVGTGDNARIGSASDGVVIAHASGVGYLQGTDTGGSAYNALGFKTSANYALYIDTSDRVGIGTAAPEGKLNIYVGSAGSVTPYADSHLIIEANTDNSFMTFLSPAGKNQGILFGDGDANWRGQVQYNHNSDNMHFYTAAVEALRLDSSQGATFLGAATFSGSIIRSAANVDVAGIQLTSTTGTNGAGIRFRNTGGDYYLAVDNSAANRLMATGQSAAYALVAMSEGDYPFIVATNGTRRAIFNSTGLSVTGELSVSSTVKAAGKLVVGSTATPISKFQIHNTQSDTMTDAEAFLALRGNGGDGLLMGQRATSPYGAWIQAGYLPNIGTSHHYPLILQPHGSNVGIGTTAPSQKLHVEGNILVNAQILTPAGSNLGLNPNTGLVTVGGALQTTSGLTVGGALTLNNAYLYTPANSYWRLGTTWNTGSMTWLNGVSVMGEMKALHLSWTAFRVGTGSTPSTGGYYLGNSYTGMYSITANTVGWIINNAEKMRLTYTGLGIGTTIPDTKLHISTTDGTSIIRLERNDSAITAGDSYGQLQWEGQDAGSGAGGVRASIEVKGFGAGTSGETAMFFRTSYVGTSRDIDAMMINHLGLVGIGTTGPGEKLEIGGVASPALKLTSSSDSNYNVKISANYSFANPANITGVNGANIISMHGYDVKVGGSGNVGINDSTPTYKLDVNGTFRTTGILYANSTSFFTGATSHAQNLNTTSQVPYVTFYGDSSANHAIGSRNSLGNAADDLRINTYGALYINLDSNNNNTSGADFRIGRHGGAGTISDWLLTVDGESGNVGIGTTAPAATLHVRDTTASTSRWTAAFVADNAAIVSAQAHDHVLIQSNDVPSLKLYEYGQDQVGGIAVGDNNCTIASTETLRFYVNGSATDNIYNGLAGTRALLLSTSGAATFVGSVTATTLTLSTGTITHGSTTILNSSRELMNIAELSINASTAGSNKLYCNGNANINGDCDASTFTGSGAALTSLNGSNISSGTVASARLGTGTASSTTYLAGNGTWSTPSGGGGGSGTVTSVSVGTGLDVSSATTTPNITLDFNELATAGTITGTDDLVVVDGTATRKEQVSTISLSAFSGYYGLINQIYKTAAGSSISPDSSGHVIMAEGTGVSLSYSGNTITFATGTSSDYRLKKNISNFNSNAWAKVKSVNLRKFDFDEDAFKIAIDSPDAEIVGVPKSYTDNVGFIAHELAEVGIEGSVIGEKDAVDADGNLLYQKINYIALVPALWGALNEAISKIETLESKVQALENK